MDFNLFIESAFLDRPFLELFLDVNFLFFVYLSILLKVRSKSQLHAVSIDPRGTDGRDVHIV